MKAISSRRVAVVAEFLASNVATTRQIMAATGYSRGSVEVALGALRRDDDECLENFRRERAGNYPNDRVAEPPAKEKPDSANVVAAALQSRTPLEQAWR